MLAIIFFLFFDFASFGNIVPPLLKIDKAKKEQYTFNWVYYSYIIIFVNSNSTIALWYDCYIGCITTYMHYTTSVYMLQPFFPNFIRFFRIFKATMHNCALQCTTTHHPRLLQRNKRINDCIFTISQTT